MTEPTIIRSDAPHEVVMPEGSNDARSKAGNVGVAAAPHTEQQSGPPMLPETLQKNMALIPDPLLVAELGETQLQSTPSPAPAAPVAVAPQEKRAPPEVLVAPPTPATVQDVMPEMDFPARIINLKIENDRVRSELDGLELKLQKPQ